MALITWGSPERKMKNGHSGEAKPRCQSSSGRTEGSFGTTTPTSCRERQPLRESGSLNPSRPWERARVRKEAVKKKMRKIKGFRQEREGGEIFNTSKCLCVWSCLTCEPPLWPLSQHLEFPSWCSQPERPCACKTEGEWGVNKQENRFWKLVYSLWTTLLYNQEWCWCQSSPL